MANGVKIETPNGKLAGIVEIKVRGKALSYPSTVPAEALPDCEACPKPELEEENLETVLVYQRISNQQTWNFVNGARMGLRMEAVVAAVRWMFERGEIVDPDAVMQRIWDLDAAINEIHNATVDKKKG